ncbi:MAG: hypothetical protein E6Q81_03375 [Thermomonas sp.]|nr:MAG: hypothetical protein E6Q81_03375 [Thermomonas sp.]
MHSGGIGAGAASERWVTPWLATRAFPSTGPRAALRFALWRCSATRDDGCPGSTSASPARRRTSVGRRGVLSWRSTATRSIRTKGRMRGRTTRGAKPVGSFGAFPPMTSTSVPSGSSIPPTNRTYGTGPYSAQRRTFGGEGSPSRTTSAERTERVPIAPNGVRSMGWGQWNLPEGWRWCRLEDVSELVKPGKLFDETTVSVGGAVPVVNQSESSYHGFHDEEPGVSATPEAPVFTFANHTCHSRLMKQPYSCIQNVFSRVGIAGVTDTTFLYYATRGRIAISGYKGHHPIFRKQWIPVPPIKVQLRLASCLSAYDDLIENNRRRIKLLEESARLLYREWFVHLRFPGHEHVKVVDGVPEGWERKPLKEIATLNYGKALKEELRQPGPYPVYGSSGIVGSHMAGLTSGPGIIVGRKGNVGSVYWSPVAFFAIDTVYYISVEQSSLYLYYALQDAQFISTDVAVPGLNRDFAYSRQLLVPADQVLSEFLEAVMPFHQQIEKLTILSEKLHEARDLLLPRLMSGDLVV